MTLTAPSPRRSHAERTHESDRRMFQAAVELITEKGLDDTTLKAVGERAGYSRGLAGYRFGNKQGLFEFVLRRVGEHWLAQLSAVTEGLSGVEAMTAAVRAHCALCCDNEAPVRAFYMLWLSAVSPTSDTREVVRNIDQRRQRDVAQWVLETDPSVTDAHAKAVGAQFSAAIIGMAYHWLARPDDHAAVAAQHDQLIHTMQHAMHARNSS
ncbi:MAG: TetR/AcrR family transcriptional regulator [Pseudomonadota bacterium]